jgi:hypothetical protein
MFTRDERPGNASTPIHRRWQNDTLTVRALGANGRRCFLVSAATQIWCRTLSQSCLLISWVSALASHAWRSRAGRNTP